MCSGDYSSFVLEKYDKKDEDGYVANKKNEKITILAMNAIEMSKQNVESGAYEKNIDLVFEKTINEFVTNEGYVIYQFTDEKSRYFTRYFPAVEAAIQDENNLKVMASYAGKVDVSKYVNFLYQGSDNIQQIKWKSFANPDQDNKITFATQAIWGSMGPDLLNDMLNDNIEKPWSFYHVLTFSKALISLTRSMHAKKLYLMNINSHSMDFRESTGYEGDELKEEFVDYSFYFGGKAFCLKYFRFFDARDSTQDHKKSTFGVEQRPPDDLKKKNWAAWDVYSIALLLMDIELATLGYGDMTLLIYMAQKKDFDELKDRNKAFMNMIFTDLKDQTKDIWKSIYPDNTDIDDISESTWGQKSEMVLRQYVIVAVLSYFHSDLYRNDLNAQVDKYTKDVEKGEDDNGKIMNFTAATINNFGATTKGPYITVLANVLLTGEDKRFSLDTFEELLNSVTIEYKTSVKKMGDFLVNLSGLANDDQKDEAIGEHLGKKQNVESVAEYEALIQPGVALPLDGRRNRRIILV
jgi:hypothetical protein